MTTAQSVPYFSPRAILNAPKKTTVIRLRWLIIIICSYLLISSPENLISSDIVHQLVIGYVLTGAVLYFFPEPLFEDPFFYSPLVIFDTLFITASLVITDQLQTEFYLAYFLIIILCAAWKDLLWSVGITGLIALLYGYFLFHSAETTSPVLTLRIPFLFAVSLFYGYFAQLVHSDSVLGGQSHKTRTDPLTGLLSRGAIEKKLKKEFGRAQRYQRDMALLMLEVDGLKRIKEAHGQAWSDCVLQKIAGYLRENLRQSDLAGMFGAEQFLVVLPEADLEDGLQAAGRIRGNVKETIFETAEGAFSVTVSVGIASTSENEYEDPPEMLSDAERMLHVARQSGNDSVKAVAPEVQDLRIENFAEKRPLH